MPKYADETLFHYFIFLMLDVPFSSQERFANLSEAYNILIDPVKREDYFREVLYQVIRLCSHICKILEWVALHRRTWVVHSSLSVSMIVPYQISGGDAGWGWNAEAAKRNAANYHWNGDEMLFQIGMCSVFVVVLWTFVDFFVIYQVVSWTMPDADLGGTTVVSVVFLV